MKNECVEIRRRIESAISRDVDPAEREVIERHCARCVSCRSYQESLLRDDARLSAFAEDRARSVQIVRERAIRRIRDASSAAGWSEGVDRTTPDDMRIDRSRARIPRFAALAAAAAVAIIAFAAIDFLRGPSHTPAPAFAAVQEKMQQRRSVIYRYRQWNLGQWITCEIAKGSSHLYRRDYGDSVIVSGHAQPNTVTELKLYPSERKAALLRVTLAQTCKKCDRPPRNPVEGIASWHKMKGFSFVRNERRDGKNIAVYEKLTNARGGLKKPKNTFTAWVDLETQLPIRLEVTGPRVGPEDDSHPYDLRLSDFGSKDSPRSSWIDLKPGEPFLVYEDFRWDTLPDTSCFSMVPPPGFRAETLDVVIDSCKTSGRELAEGIARGFSRWLSLSGNVYPEGAPFKADSTKIRSLLLAKYRRGGDPAEEFRSALKAAHVVPDFIALRDELPQADVTEDHYTGEDAIFGDSKRIVFWFKYQDPPCPGKDGEGPYFLVYADLHVDASEAPPKVAAE